MSIKEIELAITQLTHEGLSQFYCLVWGVSIPGLDEQIEEDIEAGRLDKLIKEV